MFHAFNHKNPQKSTGRHEFGKGLMEEIILKHPRIKCENLIRTFCVFTAKSIAESL